MGLFFLSIILKAHDVLIFGTPPFVKRMSLIEYILYLSIVYLP